MKLVNIKIEEGSWVTMHLNKFNSINNQLSSIEIEFDDEVRALILLATLLNIWEAMRMAVNSTVRKVKLKFDDMRDLVFTKEARGKI